MVLLRHNDSKRTAKQAWILILLTVLPVVATIAAVAILARRAHHLLPDSKEVQNLDALPLNAAANVQYTGDESCARCHPGIAQTYHRHPMARSFAPITMVQDSSPRATTWTNQTNQAGFSAERVDQRPGASKVTRCVFIIRWVGPTALKRSSTSMLDEETQGVAANVRL
jgi:hypothetical protein